MEYKLTDYNISWCQSVTTGKTLNKEVVYFFDKRKVPGMKVPKYTYPLYAQTSLFMGSVSFDTAARAYEYIQSTTSSGHLIESDDIFTMEGMNKGIGYKLAVKEPLPEMSRWVASEMALNPVMRERWAKWHEMALLLVNFYKFDQSPERWKTLDKSGDKILVYAHPNDKLLGINMTENEATRYVRSVTEWKGYNRLGFLLMEVRDTLRIPVKYSSRASTTATYTIILSCEYMFLAKQWICYVLRKCGLDIKSYRIDIGDNSLIYISLFIPHGETKVVKEIKGYLPIYPSMEVVG